MLMRTALNLWLLAPISRVPTPIPLNTWCFLHAQQSLHQQSSICSLCTVRFWWAPCQRHTVWSRTSSQGVRVSTVTFPISECRLIRLYYTVEGFIRGQFQAMMIRKTSKTLCSKRVTWANWCQRKVQIWESGKPLLGISCSAELMALHHFLLC